MFAISFTALTLYLVTLAPAYYYVIGTIMRVLLACLSDDSTYDVHGFVYLPRRWCFFLTLISFVTIVFWSAALGMPNQGGVAGGLGM